MCDKDCVTTRTSAVLFSASCEYLGKFCESVPDLASAVALVQVIVCVCAKSELREDHKLKIRESSLHFTLSVFFTL